MINQALMVSKLDAARRQLETAITLYFASGDPVSIHTLASASYNVLADLAKHRQVEIKHARRVLLETIRQEYLKEVIHHLRKAENFFKHADEDPEDSFSLRPQASEWVLIDATELYCRLTGESPPVIQVYRCWWTATHKHYLKDQNSSLYRTIEENADLLQNRSAFFHQTLPILSLQVASGTTYTV